MVAVYRNRSAVPPVLLSLLLVACGRDQPAEPSIEAAVARGGSVKAPSDVHAGPTNSTTVLVSWTDNSANEEGFRIERSATTAGPWTTAGTTGADVTSFTDGSRVTEQQVCYRVVAVRRNVESSPSSSGCTVPPAGPTSLTATTVDDQTIDLDWTDNSAVEEGYQVERATAEAGPYSTVAFLPANSVTYRQSGLTTGTPYWYRVRPTNDGGYGDFSNTASAMPEFGPPRAPTGTAATPRASGWVYVTWIDRATNEDGFRVERSLDGGATWPTSVTVGPSPSHSTDLSDFTVTGEQEVCYRVVAFNAQGDSPPSNVDCTTPPAGPTDLAASGVEGPAINLSWTDISAVEDGYVVERAGPYESFAVVANLPANSTSYRDAGVNADIYYSYRVRATGDGGFSDYSDIVAGIAVTTAPAAPSGTNAYPIGSAVITVGWTDQSTNEDGFRIERSIDGGANWELAGTVPYTNSTLYTDLDRTSEQQVCYRIIAFNSRGDSPPSNPDCTTPPAVPSGLVAATAEGLAIDLTWADNSAIEDGYEVHRLFTYCDPEGCWTYYVPLATLGPNATSYRDAGLGPDQYYTYVVVALKDGGASDTSNPASAWSDFPPTAPSNLTTVGASQGQIDLAWTGNSSNGSYFVIERCPPPWSDALVCDPSLSFAEVGWSPADVTTFSNTGLQPGTAYTYRVRACSGNGHCSDPSNEVTMTAP